MTECIHGLDIELCDICTPRVREEAVVAAPVRRKVAKVSTPRLSTTPRAKGQAAPAPSLPPGPELVTLRAHHFTHVDNLGAILAAGELRTGEKPPLDVSSAETREARAAASTPEGAPVADFVTFALTPDSSSWAALRAGARDPRWSDAARTARATDFVVLVVPVPALGDAVVATDGDASAAATRFGAGSEAAASLIRRASLNDPDLLDPELLVPAPVSIESVTLIGVANDRARDHVKALIKDAGGAAPRVAIYPPWFRPSDAE